MSRSDTIAAIATAPGRGGVAIVRVSGPDAFRVAERLSGRVPEPGRVAFRTLRSGGRLVDRGLVLAFRAPHSYTGEDTVEFQVHGGVVTPRRTLEACFAAGARLARRGEFTERAFLNGRLDLAAAEGVLELVDARTDRAADDALRRLAGEKGSEYRGLYGQALTLSATVEHALDVSEEELPAEFAGRVADGVRRLKAALAESVRRGKEGRLLHEGALVVLAGPPNAGKSSLLNALLGESRAIVSSVPGTTRDTIEEEVDWSGWPIRLVDTAGLRGTDDGIEAEGVERAVRLVENADVVVALDAEVGRADALRVHAKCDAVAAPQAGFAAEVSVSSVTGEGLDGLRAAVVARLERLAEAQGGEGGGTVRARELSLLMAAEAALAEADASELVVAANRIRSAAETLGALVGAVYSSDLLDTLFSRFCVGK